MEREIWEREIARIIIMKAANFFLWNFSFKKSREAKYTRTGCRENIRTV